jgi:hypothetical protein
MRQITRCLAIRRKLGQLPLWIVAWIVGMLGHLRRRRSDR